MGWVNSPEFFCAASETVAVNTNVYAQDPDFTFVFYLPTTVAYKTAGSTTDSTDCLQ